MPRLPPAEKLPLAVRKDVRDNWENKKEEFEKSISDILGQPWTISVNPSAIWPYAEDGSWGKTSIGSVIAAYIEGAKDKLKYFVERQGDLAKDELNSVCSAHTLTMDFDEAKKNTYCGCTVSDAGELVILFSENNLGCNIDQALEPEKLSKALNEAPSTGSAEAMSFVTRAGIDKEYTPKVGAVQEKINKLLGKEITLDPNFEAVSKALKADSKADSNWEDNLGRFTLMYFEAFADHLEYEKFGSDEMLQEGLLEVLESGVVRFRVQEKIGRSYNEPVFEDGVLYLQTTPSNFGVNINQIADKLVDLL